MNAYIAMTLFLMHEYVYCNNFFLIFLFIAYMRVSLWSFFFKQSPARVLGLQFCIFPLLLADVVSFTLLLSAPYSKGNGNVSCHRNCLRRNTLLLVCRRTSITLLLRVRGRWRGGRGVEKKCERGRESERERERGREQEGGIERERERARARGRERERKKERATQGDRDWQR